jgi:hypothetical protein
MATLLPSEGFLLGSFQGLRSHAADMATAMPSDCGDGPQLRRPCSPPQPVPRRQRTRGGVETWEDAVVRVSSSPASSDATEHFVDCYSEGEPGGWAGEGRICVDVPPSPAYCCLPLAWLAVAWISTPFPLHLYVQRPALPAAWVTMAALQRRR